MEVYAIPILEDNYAYLLVEAGSKTAAVVDPAQVAPVLDVAAHLGVTITTVLTTHAHWDHAGGNKELVAALTAAGGAPQVLGGKGDSIPAVTQEVGEGDSVTLGDAGSVTVTVHFTPCHTPGHVLFHATCPAASSEPPGDNPAAPHSIPLTACSTGEGAGGGDAAAAGAEGGTPYFALDAGHVAARGVVFTGDTLFVGGCGNFNSGTAAQMAHALLDVIAPLPPTTLLAVGHEYTAKNLAFAKTVEPASQPLADKTAWVAAQRAAGVPTVPSTVASECATNVFLRPQEAAVLAYAEAAGAALAGLEQGERDIAVVGQLRASKSAWRP